MVVARITIAQAGAAQIDPRVVPQLERVGTFVAAVLGQVDAARAREAAADRLREADQLKDKFLAMASHELRTPLTSIRGFSETISRQWEILADEDKLRFLAIVVAQSERLARLVDDLLLLSGVQSGRVALRPIPVRVEYAVEQCLRELGIDDVVVECDPHVRAYADPDHLAQMIANYVSNAMRYGAAPVIVSCASSSNDVTISVTDAGTGVHEEFRPRLFSEFQRERGFIGEHGTGLGLSIVRTLARAYGGDAWHEPNQPTGSKFHVRLPAYRG
jgi:signal transduction histidine kinase